MTQRIPIEDLNPPPISRFRVEAAMIKLIEELRVQGLSQAEIAVSLADAAEEYVLRLANKLELDEDDGNHRH